MSNRTLFYLTLLVLAGMAVLLGLNLSSIFKGKPESQPYLQYNGVRGMAIEHKGLLYTLSFQQQNQVIELLNQVDSVQNVGKGSQQKPDFTKLIVYLFDDKEDIVITPIAYVNQDLVFSAPQWSLNHYFMDVSEGQLQTLLSKTYDP